MGREGGTERVRLELTGDGVAILTLRGRNRLNLFDVRMRDSLIEALRAVEGHPDVGAMLLRSDGENFSAGADLREFGSASDRFEARWIRWRRDPWLPLWDLPCPTVAALRGIAMGSGLEMALLCDLRICGADGRLALPETRLGMLPAACGTQSLPRVGGVAAALPLTMLGTTLTAAEAKRLGLIDEIAEDVDGAALEIATALAALPGVAARAAKRALRAAADLPLREGLAVERRLARRVTTAARLGP